MNHQNTIVEVLDKKFKLFIDKKVIDKRLQEIAESINKDYAGKTPLFISILNGSFMVSSDLMKYITIPCEISFVRVASYEATNSTGKVKQILGLNQEIAGRDIIILEDIIDTGLTMIEVEEIFKNLNPASLEIATLLLKPEALKQDISIKYLGFTIENKFVVGYGLDYNGFGRNLSSLYVLCED